MTNGTATHTIFRNSRFFTGMVKFSGVVTLLLAAIFFFAGVIKVLHTPESTLHKTAGFLGVMIAAAFTVGLAVYMWGQGGRMAFYQVVFENDGLRFRLGTEKNPQEQFFGWDKIAAVEYKRIVNIQSGSVVGKDNSLVEFSSYTFFRPKKLVKLIAARAGLPIREMAS
jgi:hypothetical protein